MHQSQAARLGIILRFDSAHVTISSSSSPMGQMEQRRLKLLPLNLAP